MSLINDALKRATQAQPATTPAPAPETPMQPVRQQRPAGLPIYFTPVLLFIISGACWFLVKGWDARRQAGLYPAPITIHAREPQPATSASDATVPAGGTDTEYPIPADRQFALNDTPTPATGTASISTPDVTASAPSVVSTAAPAEPAPAPAFRLQGIFYRPANPSAVVNSKTVYVGDLISGGKVKAIDRQSVTLDVGGASQVLTLQ